MALSGLEIYKKLPKTNCKKCGFPTCLAFAMQLAAKKATLSQCPFVSEEAKKFLEEASQPPVKLISIGSGDNSVSVGNETVLFRHEETFYHPALVGIEIGDSLNDAQIDEKIKFANNFRVERVGKVLTLNIIGIKNETHSDRFEKIVSDISKKTTLNLVLISDDPDTFLRIPQVLKERRPLLCGADLNNLEKFVKIGKEFGSPVAIQAKDLEGLYLISERARALGFDDIVLNIEEDSNISKRVWDYTEIRRLALKKNLRTFGYPIISRVSDDNPMSEFFNASASILKYSSIVLMKNTDPEIILPLLTIRDDIYTDPQKPVQVEPKIYEIGNVNEKSPVLITTNFSITYFTVAGEVEASKIPSYILSVDAEGMSVLTAWAAEKFTPDRIVKSINDSGIMNKVSHKKIIIPGYVAIMSGKLEEESQLEIVVGPREASGIPVFLKSLPH